MAQSGEVVLVTAATSFIGTHCINFLLQEGWKVRGTVRKLNSSKTKALQEVFQAYPNLELIEADLSNTECWDGACQGCAYVLHLACPVDTSNFAKDPMNRYLKEPAEIQKTIDTVVGGTLCVLNAAKAAGVKRIVMASSVAAMIPSGWCEVAMPYRKEVPGAFDPEAHKKTICEDTWSDLKVVDGYIKCKTVSEQEAWKAMEGSKTEITMINPCFVLGPQLHKDLCSDSATPIDICMNQPPNNPKSLPGLLSIQMLFSDVRDVAKAHIRAMTLPQAAGQRYFIADRVMDHIDMADFIADIFKPMGYNCLTRRIPKCVIACMACCDPLMARANQVWGTYPKVDNSKMYRDLLPEIVDMKTSIIDTILSAVATGRYERKPGFKTDKPEYQGTGALKLTAKLN